MSDAQPEQSKYMRCLPQNVTEESQQHIKIGVRGREDTQEKAKDPEVHTVNMKIQLRGGNKLRLLEKEHLFRMEGGRQKEIFIQKSCYHLKLLQTEKS